MITIATWIFGQISLVRFLRLGKALDWGYLRANGSTSKTIDQTLIDCLLQFVSNPLGDKRLWTIPRKDPTRILQSSIISLSTRSGWIMELEKESNKFLKMLFGFIELNEKYFNVSRLTGANLLVGRISELWIDFGITCHESHGTRFDGSRKLLLKVVSHEFFRAPITTRAQGQDRRKRFCRWYGR
jgi:hypothetical protein